MESAANRLQKEAKGYLDSLRGDTIQVPRSRGMRIDDIYSDDGFTNEDSGDNRCFLRRCGSERWCEQKL